MIDGRSIHLDAGCAGRAPGKRTLTAVEARCLQIPEPYFHIFFLWLFTFTKRKGKEGKETDC